MIRLLDRLSWLITLLAAGTILVMVSLLVFTTGNIDVLGLRASSAITPTPISIGPTPVAGLPGGQTPIIKATGPAPLNSVLPKRLLFANVPLPQEVSLRPQVIVTNLLLAIILALAFGTISAVLNKMIREQGGTFRDWLKDIHFGWLATLISSGSKQAIRRGCLGLPIIMIIFALYGIIFATLERGTSILNPDGVQLAIVMAVSVGLISLGGDIARRWISRLWRSKTRYGVYPANLLIAIGTTILSRALRLSPGIVFGVPGRADIELNGEQRPGREVVLALTTLVTVLILGGLAWAATGVLAQVGTQTVSADILTFWGPIARLAQTTGLAIFTVVVQTAFFEMLPLSATLGNKIFSWSGFLWTIIFVPVVFIFAHTMLNPYGEFLAAFQSANVQLTLLLTGTLVVITMLLWVYVRIILRRSYPTPATGLSVHDTQPTAAYAPVVIARPTESRPEVEYSQPETIETPRVTPPSLITVKIKLPSYRPPDEEIASDTRPGPAVEIQEPGATDEDTKPGEPADEVIASPFDSDPAYRYKNLFPPPRPGDEDYLESGFPEETPPAASGDTPAEERPRNKPEPPDSLPL